ncbi:hypothetical protein [Brevibacillus dissolubilis]|uniref:hypothetical protein n=1 Tax=Brevibacillus dissolubilis TaxID=1844116 RepID=UPI0011171A2F|nr:hypothetical protein [Brevibacillus dissolubilis]
MSMQRNLMIKHMVGSRSFLDAVKQGIAYELHEVTGGWEFLIHTDQREIVDELVSNRHELNLFVVEETPGQPTQKWWYYSKDGDVTYDEASHVVRIFADSKMGYQS